MKKVIKRNTCRMCHSKNLELAFKLNPSPVGDDFIREDRLGQVQESYPIDLYLCHNCGLAQLLDIVQPEDIYYDYIYVTASSPGLALHFNKYAREVIDKFSLNQGSLVVDIGSNDGLLLSCFQNDGMVVLGIDPAPAIAKEATKRGIETIPAFFSQQLVNDIIEKYGKASIVTANNVLANIDELGNVLKGVHNLLAQDGVFIFESFYLADLINNMVFDFIYHEHISAFTVKPIKAFLSKYKLELIDVDRVSTKGGSLRYYAQLEGGPRPKKAIIEEMIESEVNAGLFDIRTYQEFSLKIDLLRDKSDNYLNRVAAEGASIVGFGASITGTTLIYHFEVGKYLKYLIDDNPAKQGRYSPGLHLPVKKPDIIYSDKPDYIVILAWRFADQIINNHKDYLDQGGQFIIPVPEFKVVGNIIT